MKSNLSASSFGNSFRVATFSAFVIAALVGTTSVRAGTKTWTGASSGLWTVGANWSGGVAPVNGDYLIFPDGATRTTITNDFAGLYRLRPSYITVSGHGYVMRGNSLTISNDLLVLHPAPYVNTIEFGIAWADGQPHQLICNSLGASLVVTGAVALGSITLTNSGDGNSSFSGVISGTGGITKSGKGTMVMSGAGANTYSGTTLVTAGTLELGKSGTSKVAVPGPFVVGNGSTPATVRFTDDFQIAGAVTINDGSVMLMNDHSDGISTLTLKGGQVLTGSGHLTLGGTVTILASSQIASFDGNLDLSGLTREFNVAAGGSGSADFTITGRIYETGPGTGITKTGPGTMRLYNCANSFTGPTTVSNGVLQVQSPTGLGSAAGGTILAGGTLSLESVAIASESLTNISSTSKLQVVAGASASWGSNVVLNADLNVAVLSGATLDITGIVSGPAGLIKTQPGTLSFSGSAYNSYSGTTRHNQGTMVLNRTRGYALGYGPLVIGDGLGGADADVVRCKAPGQLWDLMPVTISSSGLLDVADGVGTSVGSVSGSGHIGLGTVGNAYFVAGHDNNSTVFSGVISGAGTVFKDGTGALTLTGANTYTGLTYLRDGALSVNGSQFQSDVYLYDVFSSDPRSRTMGGGGTVGTISGTSGRLSPGTAGTLTSKNVTLNSAWTFDVSLNGSAAGVSYGQLNVIGSVNLGNATLKVALGFASPINSSYTIINNDANEPVVGTFNGLPEGATLNISGTQFRISYVGGTGNDVVLTQIEPFQQPKLGIQKTSATEVTLSWSANFTGYVLESNTNLMANVWTAVPAPVGLNGMNNVVVDSANGSQKFYRLRRQ